MIANYYYIHEISNIPPPLYPFLKKKIPPLGGIDPSNKMKK
jgi:uncharacterized protein YggT (Ycf19 family)